jgi:hypothetical protein
VRALKPRHAEYSATGDEEGGVGLAVIDQSSKLGNHFKERMGAIMAANTVRNTGEMRVRAKEMRKGDRKLAMACSITTDSPGNTQVAPLRYTKKGAKQQWRRVGDRCS